MITAKYTSRIPQSAARLPIAVGAPIKAGAERIAQTAAANAPDRPPPYEGLPASIEAKSVEYSGVGDLAGGVGYGIVAAWYWKYLEFGTTKISPRPFMLPAAEAQMPSIVTEVQAAMRAL